MQSMWSDLRGGDVLNPFRDRKSDSDSEAAESEEEVAVEDVEAEVDETATSEEVEAGGAEEDASTDGPAGELEAELAELKDRHLRLAAEFENFRKRTRKEAATGRAAAQAELARQILPTLDDLARVADTPHESTTVQALDEGIELILRNLRKQLADAGLTRIEAQGEPFDPERHEAVMATQVDDPELDDTVGRVFLDGYEFLDRLVRPAQVEVRRYEDDDETAEDAADETAEDADDGADEA